MRPRRGRWVAETFAVLALLTWVLGAVWLPGGAEGYGPADRVALVAVGLAMATVLHRLADVRIIVADDGLLVVNPLRRRLVPWWQIRGVRLEPGDPWLVLQLVDAEVVHAMGVQGSDGPYAREQAMLLARQVVARSPREG